MAKKVKKYVKRQKRYRKKYKRNAINRGPRMSTVTVKNGTNPFPDKLYTKLKYTDVKDFGTVSVGFQQYRMNSIYDPDVTSTGHQVYGHDTYAYIFQKYRVHRIDWKIRFVNASSDIPFICVVNQMPDDVTYGSASQVLLLSESADVKSGIASYRNKECVLSGHALIRDIIGMTKQQYMCSDTLVSAIFGANPTQDCMLNLAAVTSDSTTTARLIMYIDLEYWVELYETVPQSSS